MGSTNKEGMKMKHTELPWSHSLPYGADIMGVDGKNLAISLCKEMREIIIPSGAETISPLTREESFANAALIVKCVNSHDKLVKALEDMLKASEKISIYDSFWLLDEVQQAREALAAAKGE